MNQTVDLDGLTKATRRREFDDGLIDFTVGAGYLVLGILAWFLFSPGGVRWYAIALLKNRTLTLFGLASLAVLILVGARGARRAIDRIRASTTWRVSGFVKPLRMQAGWPTMVLSGVVTLGIIIGASWFMAIGRLGAENALRTLVASSGIATGIVYFGMGVAVGLRRYLAVGLAGGILSAVILFMPLSFSVAWLVLGTIWIIVLGVSGAWALRLTLSANLDSSSE